MNAPQNISNWSLLQKVAFRLFSAFFIVYILLNPNGAIPVPFFGELYSLYIKPFQWIATWMSSHIFNLPQQPATEFNGSGDTTMQYLLLLANGVIAVVGCFIWSLADYKRTSYNKALYWVSVCIRYYLATTMISYGFAKLFKTQFPYPSYYRLTETYGNSSPMGLAWTFFGYSLWYNYFMGFAEVLGAALLLFRRTATLGALVTLSVAANIMAVNYSFDVPVKILSTTLVAMSLFLLARETNRLISFFILNKVTPAATNITLLFKRRWQKNTLIVLKYLLIINVLGGSIENGIQNKKIVESYMQDEKLYGYYDVKHPPTKSDQKPDSTAWLNFTIIPDSIRVTLINNSIRIYTYQLDKDSKQLKIFPSVYAIEPAYILNYNTTVPDKATLTATVKSGKINLQAKKSQESGFPLITRGFHWINERPNNK